MYGGGIGGRGGRGGDSTKIVCFKCGEERHKRYEYPPEDKNEGTAIVALGI